MAVKAISPLGRTEEQRKAEAAKVRAELQAFQRRERADVRTVRRSLSQSISQNTMPPKDNITTASPGSSTDGQANINQRNTINQLLKLQTIDIRKFKGTRRQGETYIDDGPTYDEYVQSLEEYFAANKITDDKVKINEFNKNLHPTQGSALHFAHIAREKDRFTTFGELVKYFGQVTDHKQRSMSAAIQGRILRPKITDNCPSSMVAKVNKMAIDMTKAYFNRTEYRGATERRDARKLVQDAYEVALNTLYFGIEAEKKVIDKHPNTVTDHELMLKMIEHLTEKEWGSKQGNNHNQVMAFTPNDAKFPRNNQNQNPGARFNYNQNANSNYQRNGPSGGNFRNQNYSNNQSGRNFRNQNNNNNNNQTGRTFPNQFKNQNSQQQGYKQNPRNASQQPRGNSNQGKHNPNAQGNAQQDQTQYCDRCTGNHAKSTCKWSKDTQCHACKKLGHISTACRSNMAKNNSQQGRPFRK